MTASSPFILRDTTKPPLSGPCSVSDLISSPITETDCISDPDFFLGDTLVQRPHRSRLLVLVVGSSASFLSQGFAVNFSSLRPPVFRLTSFGLHVFSAFAGVLLTPLYRTFSTTHFASLGFFTFRPFAGLTSADLGSWVNWNFVRPFVASSPHPCCCVLFL